MLTKIPTPSIIDVPKDVVINNILPYLEDEDVVNFLTICKYFYQHPDYKKIRENRVMGLRIRETHILPDLLIELCLRKESVENLLRLLALLKALPNEFPDQLISTFFKSPNSYQILNALLGKAYVGDMGEPKSIANFYALAGHWDEFHKLKQEHFSSFKFSNEVLDVLHLRGDYKIAEYAVFGGQEAFLSELSKYCQYPSIDKPKNVLYFNLLLKSAIFSGRIDLIKKFNQDLPAFASQRLVRRKRNPLVKVKDCLSRYKSFCPYDAYLSQALQNGFFEFVDFLTEGKAPYVPIRYKEQAFEIMLYAFRYGDIERAEKIKKEWRLSSEYALERKDIFTHALEGGSIKAVEYVRSKVEKIKMNRAFERGRNALHVAAFHGHIQLCHTLIEVDKFDPSGEDETGIMMVHEAAKSGYWGCYINLARKYHKDDLLIPTPRGLTAVHCAAEHGQYWFLLKAISFFGDECLDAKTKKGDTILHFAICSRNIDLVEWLVNERNFQLDEKNNDGKTPMHQLVWHSNTLGNRDGWKFLDELVDVFGLNILEFRNKIGETVVELLPYDLREQYQQELQQRQNVL